MARCFEKKPRLPTRTRSALDRDLRLGSSTAPRRAAASSKTKGWSFRFATVTVDSTSRSPRRPKPAASKHASSAAVVTSTAQSKASQVIAGASA